MIRKQTVIMQQSDLSLSLQCLVRPICPKTDAMYGSNEILTSGRLSGKRMQEYQNARPLSSRGGKHPHTAVQLHLILVYQLMSGARLIRQALYEKSICFKYR